MQLSRLLCHYVFQSEFKNLTALLLKCAATKYVQAKRLSFDWVQIQS